MRKFVACAALAVAAAITASPAAAQQTSGPSMPGEAVTSGHGSFYVGPYVGYMVFGDFADLGSSNDLSFDNGLFYGAQVGYSFSPNISLVGNLGYSKSNYEVKVEGDAANSDIPGEIGLFFYDANLQFRMPFVANRVGSTVAPFVQLGAGAVKRTFDTDDLFNGAGATDFAFNAGLGVDFQIRKAIGLRFMAKDYVTSFSWDEADDVDNEVRSGAKDNVANNFAFTIGLNFGF